MEFTTYPIAIWCLLVAVFLPIVATGIAKKNGFSTPPSEGGYDNHQPREWIARQTGASARANAAHENTFEALPFFYAAVLLAHFSGANVWWLNALAIAWVLLRILYIVCYIKDWASQRSLVWAIALVTNIAIFCLAA